MVEYSQTYLIDRIMVLEEKIKRIQDILNLTEIQPFLKFDLIDKVVNYEA